MNILMATNTYLPHVGGVARSVERFRQAYLAAGHEVLVIAPAQGDATVSTDGVLRVPAIRDFRHSGFSVSLPLPPGYLDDAVKQFQPHVVHTHHPFLLGNTALRLARSLCLPIVQTYHTRYDKYTHYFVEDSEALQRFVVDLSRRFADLCDHVIAPSRSLSQYLHELGVQQPVSVIPTGVNLEEFENADGAAFRQAHDIPRDAWVVGHVGRLAPEKNMEFLADALVRFLRDQPQAWAIIVGDGPARSRIEEIFAEGGVDDRARCVGVQTGADLTNAYGAMDVFAFASKTETQGMVLVEAMAAGVPVVALQAPAVEDVVRDGNNGFLIQQEEADRVAAGLAEMHGLDAEARARFEAGASETADAYSTTACADKALALYQRLRYRKLQETATDESALAPLLRRMESEWELLWNNIGAATQAIL